MQLRELREFYGNFIRVVLTVLPSFYFQLSYAIQSSPVISFFIYISLRFSFNSKRFPLIFPKEEICLETFKQSEVKRFRKRSICSFRTSFVDSVISIITGYTLHKKHRLILSRFRFPIHGKIAVPILSDVSRIPLEI